MTGRELALNQGAYPDPFGLPSLADGEGAGPGFPRSLGPGAVSLATG